MLYANICMMFTFCMYVYIYMYNIFENTVHPVLIPVPIYLLINFIKFKYVNFKK